MPEAVIVATARTPIGRAIKGSLIDVPPRRPRRHHRQGRPRQGAGARPAAWSRTSSSGCGQPAGEAGYNLARVAADPGRHARRPRRHRQPLLLVVAADDPHGRPRHQGRRGRRVRRRRRRDRQPLPATARPTPARTTPRSPTPRPAPPSAPTAARRRGRRRPACPTSTSPWARPPRTSAESEKRRPRGAWTSSPPCRQQRATASLENGFFEREITPVDRRRRRHASSSKDDGIRAGTTVEEPRRAQAGVPPRRHGHRRQRLPAQRRRRRRHRHERHQGQASSASPRSPASSSSGVTGLNPEIMGLGPIEACRQALEPAGMTIDDIDLVEINEAFAAQVIPSAKHLGIPLGQAQRQRRRHRPRPPVRHDRRPHHDHADQRPPGRRQDLRPRVDVRRRRPGHGHDRRAPLERSNETGARPGTSVRVWVVRPRDRSAVAVVW